MTHAKLYEAWTQNTQCEFSIDSDPVRAFAKVHDIPCLEGPRVLQADASLRNLCQSEIDKGSFWWADHIALRRDIDSITEFSKN